MARGDFNNDGVADLVVGIPEKDLTFQSLVTIANGGAVQILYGTRTNGLLASTGSVLPSQLLTELSPLVSLPANLVDEKAEGNDRFGAVVAAGKFNSDSFSDLAVGIPGERASGTTAVGAVMVFSGSASGLSTSPTQFFPPTVFYPVTQPGNAHGPSSLTWGDFDQDGVGDLAVATDYTTDFKVQRSVVTVLYGSASGLTTMRKDQVELDLVTLSSQVQNAPLVLTAGDFDHDGFSDLAVGSPTSSLTIPCTPPPGETTCTDIVSESAGVVHVLYGSPFGLLGEPQAIHLSQQLWSESIAGVPGGGPSPGERFGAALAAGDFNHDSVDDLAIGVPGENSVSNGVVVIIPGHLSFGLQAVGTVGASSLSPVGESQVCGPHFCITDFGSFGSALAAADFDGDGIKDLAIGSPSARAFTSPATTTVFSAGSVEVVFGTTGGLSRTLGRRPQVLFQDLLGDDVEGGEQFGSALTAWDFGKGTQADLVVGAPFEDVGRISDAGMVHAIYGSATGLLINGGPLVDSQTWTENSAGLHNAAVAQDHFGGSLY